MNLHCKMSDIFPWFLLALRFSATNSGIKKTLTMSTGTCELKLFAQNNIFKTGNYKYEILNHLYFGPSFVFWRTALGRFSQRFFFFLISVVGQPWWPTFLLSTLPPPHNIKNFPTALQCSRKWETFGESHIQKTEKVKVHNNVK